MKKKEQNYSISKIENGQFLIKFLQPIQFNYKNYLLTGTHRISMLINEKENTITGIQGEKEDLLLWLKSVDTISQKVAQNISVQLEEVSNNEKFLHFDEKSIAMFTLELVVETMEKLVTTKILEYWQIIIILLHNALQAFMVWSLTGSHYLRTLKKKDAQNWLKWYESKDSGNDHQNIENLKLDFFLELYGKIKSKEVSQINTFSKQFPAERSHDLAVEKLNELRNEFIHFTPKLFSIKVSGLSLMALKCLEVIEFLAFESNNIFMSNGSYNDPIEVNRVRKCIEQCKNYLQ